MIRLADGGIRLETNAERAVVYLLWLDRNGGRYWLDDDGCLRVDLNGIPTITDDDTAERMAAAILSVSPEIKAILSRRKMN